MQYPLSSISISVWGCVFLVCLHSSRRLCRSFTADRQTGGNQQRGTESLSCNRRYCSLYIYTNIYIWNLLSSRWLVTSPVPVKHPPSVVSHHPLVSRSVLARNAVIFGPLGSFSGSRRSLRLASSLSDVSPLAGYMSGRIASYWLINVYSPQADSSK